MEGATQDHQAFRPRQYDPARPEPRSGGCDRLPRHLNQVRWLQAKRGSLVDRSEQAIHGGGEVVELFDGAHQELLIIPAPETRPRNGSPSVRQIGFYCCFGREERPA